MIYYFHKFDCLGSYCIWRSTEIRLWEIDIKHTRDTLYSVYTNQKLIYRKMEKRN